ncbi:MAG TPA: acyltransferase family protein [Rhodocyclaceae bacterium]|nr:acyltransferase family protein [Rhodocyclaceae bacterium]
MSNPPARPPRHIGFLDPIRVLLVLLVIAHHTSITYGGSGDWYYREAGSPEWLKTLLSVFTGTNQAFFMGFFFLIAGYFTPASLARKGTAGFLRERAWRLGVPVLVFAALLSPLTRALAAGARGEDFLPALWHALGQLRFDPGPLWFNIALLMLSAPWVFIARRLPPVASPRMGLHAAIALAVLGCGALAFALRLAMPVGRSFFHMQIGYFASYLLLFYGGGWMAGQHFLERVEWAHARRWVWLAVAVYPVLWLSAAFAGAFDGDTWRGGWHLPALIYAFWEPFIAAGVILGSLALFRRYLPQPGRAWRRLADASFAAFVIHPPLVVASSWLVQPLSSAPLMRFVLAAPLAGLMAFGLADTWRRHLAPRQQDT